MDSIIESMPFTMKVRLKKELQRMNLERWQAKEPTGPALVLRYYEQILAEEQQKKTKEKTK